jgi:hypothetical protein
MNFPGRWRMDLIPGFWVAEYSASRDCFRQQLLVEALRSNIYHANRKEHDDWALVAVGTRDYVERAVRVICDAQAILADSRRVPLNLNPHLYVAPSSLRDAAPGAGE